MLIHEIHNLENHAVSFLIDEFSKITDTDIVKNYHPDYSHDPANFFYVLESGRFRKGHGKYYVIEEDNRFVCSAGWNEYDIDPTIALCLSRMYISNKYRTKYYVGTHILPLALTETTHYEKVWMTVNRYNRALYQWFERVSTGKQPTLFDEWPDIYKRFSPIGIREIYYTEQYVVELKDR